MDEGLDLFALTAYLAIVPATLVVWLVVTQVRLLKDAMRDSKPTLVVTLSGSLACTFGAVAIAVVGLYEMVHRSLLR